MSWFKRLFGLTEEQKAKREARLTYLKEKEKLETDAYRKAMLEKAPEAGQARAAAEIEEQKKAIEEGKEKKKGILKAFDDLTKAAANFDIKGFDKATTEKETKKDPLKDLEEFLKKM